jgi:fatty acid synthase
MYRNINILKAGGVELRGMKASLAPRRQQMQAAPKLEQYAFIPYDSTAQSKVGIYCIYAYTISVCTSIKMSEARILEAKLIKES